MILFEKELHSRVLEPILGRPKRINRKYIRSIGSTSYFLTSFFQSNNEENTLRINSKCNFQLYENGILLRANFSTQVRAIPIKYSEIQELKLIRGKEHIDPLYFSLMGILMRLGVSVLKARYFKAEFSEYTIDDMVLELKTKDYKMSFCTNGHQFETQESLFKMTPIELTIVIQ